MSKTIGKWIMVFISCFILIGCDVADDVANDEIALHIQLATKEDIGLLVIDYDVNGIKGSGGIANANRSLLKHDETLFFTLRKEQLNNVSDMENMEIRFTIISEYVDPNYDNIYPSEYTIPLEPLMFHANYGKSYFFTISGDQINGYQVVLDE